MSELAKNLVERSNFKFFKSENASKKILILRYNMSDRVKNIFISSLNLNFYIKTSDLCHINLFNL